MTAYNIGCPKSHEILMIVCLQKDIKQCCGATKLEGFHCACLKPALEYTLTLWCHSIVWHLFGDKQTSKCHNNKGPYPSLYLLLLL